MTRPKSQYGRGENLTQLASKMASLSDLDNLRLDICTADNYVGITLPVI